MDEGVQQSLELHGRYWQFESNPRVVAWPSFGTSPHPLCGADVSKSLGVIECGHAAMEGQEQALRNPRKTRRDTTYPGSRLQWRRPPRSVSFARTQPSPVFLWHTSLEGTGYTRS